MKSQMSLRMRLTAIVSTLIAMVLFAFTRFTIFHAERVLFTPKIYTAIEQQASMAQARHHYIQVFAIQAYIFMLVAIAIVTVLAYWASAYALRPIHVLTNHLVTKDESFELLDYSEELLPIVDAISHQYYQLSKAKKKEADIASALKYDLQAPIKTLIDTVDLANKDTQASVSEYQDTLNTVSEHADTIAKVANNLALISTASQCVKEDRISMDILLKEVILKLTDKFLRKKIQLDLEVRGNFTLEANERYLHQAVTNVLENAIQYCDEEGKISVVVTSDGVVRISDDGIGIESQHREYIFEPFYKVDAYNETSSGLGLTVSKEIIEHHHGQIRYQKHESKGSIFELSFNQALAL